MSADDDDGHLATGVWALRLAVAHASGARDAAELIAHEIDAERGCWACIAGELLTILATVVGADELAWLQEQLADALDQAAIHDD